MCGRFVSASPPDEIAEYFDAVVPEASTTAVLDPSWNVAPTDDVYGVTNTDGTRRIEVFHWGLVPYWAKDPGVGSRMINARAETILTKNAFRPALERRRCLVPATGFYEWQAVPGQKKKQPMFIHDPAGHPLAFAGLWERWRPRPPADEKADAAAEDLLHSCTIITTTANELMRPVHDRMPVILPPDLWSTWLDPANEDVDALAGLLVPAAEDVLERYPVGSEVGNVANQGPQLMARVTPETAVQGTLL